MSIKSTWDKHIKLNGMPKFCTGQFNLNFKEFEDLVKNNAQKEIEVIIKRLTLGEVLILKDTFSKETTKLMKQNAKKFFQENDNIFHKMHDGCPNFHRIIDEEISANYASPRVCHSFYVFPWNNDDLGVRDIIMDRWRTLKKFNGLDPHEYDWYLRQNPNCPVPASPWFFSDPHRSLSQPVDFQLGLSVYKR